MSYPTSITDIPVRTDGADQVILAAHMNMIRTAFLDLNTVLGNTPQGAVASLQTRLATILGTDGNLENFGQVRIVGKSGCKYTTIQSAIDSITDASASKLYSVLVLPGVYAETVTPKAYVTVTGLSRTACQITAPAASNAVIIAGGNLENLDIWSNRTQAAVACSGGNRIYIRNCTIKSTSGNTVETSADDIFFELCDIQNSGGNHCIRQTAGFSRYSYCYTRTTEEADIHVEVGDAYITHCFMNGDVAGQVDEGASISASLNFARNGFGGGGAVYKGYFNGTNCDDWSAP